MEMEALQLHLIKRHKHCPPLTQPSLLPDPSLTHSYLTDRRVTSEWQVKLWAQRTGELFLWGAQAWSPQATLLPTTLQTASPCPLCGMKTFNLSLHWFQNCQAFTAQYDKGAELQWQALLTHVRHILYATPPTHALFTALKDPQGPHAQAASALPSKRLQKFWYMDGIGTPSAHLIPLLIALRHDYTSLILALQKQVSITNSLILREASKKLGAFPCTTLDAC